MRKALVMLLGVCLLALFVGSVSARDIDRSNDLHVNKAVADGENPALIDQGLQSLMASAAVDTFCIIWYDFEPMDWQGWVAEDNTAQVDVFFHVDDFGGLGGGFADRLNPIEGSKSLWCGTRPGNDFYLCSWSNAPGYGNSWNQICVSDPIAFTGILTWSFKAVIDSEQGYDFTAIEYDAGDENWIEIDIYDNVDTLDVSYQLLLSQANTKLRYHFTADGAWSDQDGLINTDGACIIDEINITDAGGLINYEDFETYDVGDNTDLGIWNPEGEAPFGIYAELMSNLVDKDPCADNFGSQLIFFNGSSYPSSDYPGLYDTPFCVGPGAIEAPCQDETVVSPVIDMTKYSSGCNTSQDQDIATGDLNQLGGALLRFVVYRDLPKVNLVYYQWGVRSIDVDNNDCPGTWLDRNYVYYGPDKDYIQIEEDVSDLVSHAPMQMRVGARDMCDIWWEDGDDCSAHTPSPWIDNVRFYRYKTVGPSWSFRGLELFQDTFPQDLGGEVPMEEICRADMASDIAPDAEGDRIDPGDSAVVKCSAPLAGGLDTLVTGEDRVYFHCKVHFLGPEPETERPIFTGSVLEGSDGSFVGMEGDWNVFLCEPAQGASGAVVDEYYAIDLNDSLFTRGYMVEYYFKGYDLLGYSSTLPASAEDVDGNRWEFTCLPTLRTVPGVLYCDDFHGRGTFEGQVQQYYDPAFKAVSDGEAALPDRYDTNAPTSGVSNGVGAYVSADGPQSIFCQAYEKVIFDSGDLNSYTICDGTMANSDKSNDAQLLVNWMRSAGHKVGLLVMGEGIADDLNNSAAAIALELMQTICGVALVDVSYYEETGGRTAGGTITPLITGVSGGPYEGMSYYAFGGCPIINAFDMIETSGTQAHYALQYPDYMDGDELKEYYAGIWTNQTNTLGHALRTVWVGHSFMAIRDTELGVPFRNQFLGATYEFFENAVSGDYTDTELPKVYSLAQNFPNPFNPSTRIQFALPSKGHVSLKIYNVAGQLVKTLQDGVMDAGSHELTWDGANNLGTNVASGVYFYKINAGDNYENTKKMVLLR